MADGFIGEIRLFAGNFAPQGWALCEGQLLAISQHTALFSILGTAYGGDGKSSFALPDLRGRVRDEVVRVVDSWRQPRRNGRADRVAQPEL